MRIVVVGAGVIGVASAYHLVKDGHEVTVVDALTPGAGASHANAGWVVPADVGPVPAPGMVLKGLKWMLHRDSPLYVKPSLRPEFVRFMLAMARRCNATDFDAALRANLVLCEDTMSLFDAYASDSVRFEMHAEGLIMAHTDRDAFERRVAALAVPREHGLEPEVLTGEQLAAREPALRPTLAGGVYFPHERHLRPDSLMTGLAERCRQLGVTFLNHAPVTGVQRDDRARSLVRALVTPAGTVEGDVFLLAAGAYSGPLARLFGTPLPVRPGKGYSLDYTPAPVKLSRAVNLCDAKVAVTPLDGRLRLAGTMEFAGLDEKVNPVRVTAIKRAPAQYFRDWDPGRLTHSAPWAGARPMTPDGLPIIGQLPGLANAWVATGHGMLGVTLGPGTARAVAEAIGNGSLPPRLGAFSPDRFFSRSRRPTSHPRPRTNPRRLHGFRAA